MAKQPQNIWNTKHNPLGSTTYLSDNGNIRIEYKKVHPVSFAFRLPSPNFGTYSPCFRGHLTESGWEFTYGQGLHLVPLSRESPNIRYLDKVRPYKPQIINSNLPKELQQGLLEMLALSNGRNTSRKS